MHHCLDCLDLYFHCCDWNQLNVAAPEVDDYLNLTHFHRHHCQIQMRGQHPIFLPFILYLKYIIILLTSYKILSLQYFYYI